MSLLPLFEWFYSTTIGEEVRNSLWLFAVLEAFHLVGLGLTAGAVLLVDLRLFGVGLVKQPVDELAGEAQPWLLGGVTLMFASGIPLFLCEAVKCYHNFAFWVKMISLFLVLLFTFTIRRHVAGTGLTVDALPLGKVTALVSLGLWFGVAWGGRWIGFS